MDKIDPSLETRIKAAIDLDTVLVVERIAEKEGRPTADVLSEFLTSKTAEMLYDEPSKLWWDGPASIANDYEEELARRQS